MSFTDFRRGKGSDQIDGKKNKGESQEEDEGGRRKYV